jgi:hypothetical protein
VGVFGSALERDPEKWVPVFGEGHAQSKICCRGTDNFGVGVNSRQSTMRDFSVAAVVTTYL